MSSAPLREPEVPTLRLADAAPERAGMVGSLLKSPEHFARSVAEDACDWRGILTFLGTAVLFYALYGLAMGVFAGGQALWLAAVKTPLILLASLGLCGPSLYVLLCLTGTPINLRQLAALLAGVACLSSLLLVGLAPVAWLFGVSTNNLPFMVLLHLAVWAIGLTCGLRLLGLASFSSERRHKPLLFVWIPIYLIVSAQMLTYFRPLLIPPSNGDFREATKKFFFEHFVDSMGAGYTPCGAP